MHGLNPCQISEYIKAKTRIAVKLKWNELLNAIVGLGCQRKAQELVTNVLKARMARGFEFKKGTGIK